VRADPLALVLALDIGTTGAKAAAVSKSGRIHASASAGYERGTCSDGACVEQWPADWLAAAADAATRCVAALPPVRSACMQRAQLQPQRNANAPCAFSHSRARPWQPLR
jgi:glycerol kinase